MSRPSILLPSILLPSTRTRRFRTGVVPLATVVEAATELLRSGGWWSISELAGRLADTGVGNKTEKGLKAIQRRVSDFICVAESLGHTESLVCRRRRKSTATSPPSGATRYHWRGAVARRPSDTDDDDPVPKRRAASHKRTRDEPSDLLCTLCGVPRIADEEPVATVSPLDPSDALSSEDPLLPVPADDTFLPLSPCETQTPDASAEWVAEGWQELFDTQI
jgi:hypothetical protein